MDKEWEAAFAAWAEGPGSTEQEKAENAEAVVRNAVKESEHLDGWDVSVGAHGSYRARTNIKTDRDVDVYVRLNTHEFFSLYPTGKSREDFGNSKGAVDYDDFRNRVEGALKDYLGEEAVARGKKAFDLHENSYRIDADVIAVLPHRWYTGSRNPEGTHEFLEGIAFRMDDGTIVRSWPDRTYANGVAKNTRTNRRYKRAIRILKNLRNYMVGKYGVAEAKGIASYLIECLVWNVPDSEFGAGQYWEDAYRVLSFLVRETAAFEACRDWVEVNEFRYLFDSDQLWSHGQARDFVAAAWQFLEFEGV